MARPHPFIYSQWSIFSVKYLMNVYCGLTMKLRQNGFLWLEPQKKIECNWNVKTKWCEFQISVHLVYREKWQWSNHLKRLCREPLSDNTLLAPICYFIKTNQAANGYYAEWVSLHCLCIKVECTNSGDWSDCTNATCHQWNVSPIILQNF